MIEIITKSLQTIFEVGIHAGLFGMLPVLIIPFLFGLLIGTVITARIN